MINISSTALAATISGPSRAPISVSDAKQSCSSSERSIMSRLRRSRRLISPRQLSFSIAIEMPRSFSTRHTIASPTASVTYSASAVALAAPATPHFRPSTSHRSSRILTALPTTSSTTGARAYCTPSSQPRITMLASVAGALSQRISIKIAACSCTCGSPPASRPVSALSGSRSRINSRPASSAISSGCVRARASACVSRAPKACAVMPVVLMRRKSKSIKTKLVAVAPIATPPR